MQEIAKNYRRNFRFQWGTYSADLVCIFPDEMNRRIIYIIMASDDGNVYSPVRLYILISRQNTRITMISENFKGTIEILSASHGIESYTE